MALASLLHLNRRSLHFPCKNFGGKKKIECIDMTLLIMMIVYKSNLLRSTHTFTWSFVIGVQTVVVVVQHQYRSTVGVIANERG